MNAPYRRRIRMMMPFGLIIFSYLSLPNPLISCAFMPDGRRKKTLGFPDKPRSRSRSPLDVCDRFRSRDSSQKICGSRRFATLAWVGHKWDRSGLGNTKLVHFWDTDPRPEPNLQLYPKIFIYYTLSGPWGQFINHHGSSGGRPMLSQVPPPRHRIQPPCRVRLLQP